MAITTLDEKCEINCDHCPFSSPAYHRSDFRLMIIEAKDAGWFITKNDKTKKFQHACPACAGVARAEFFAEKYQRDYQHG